MNLCAAIYSLPEQQQIDLIRHCANNMNSHGKNAPTQVFAASKAASFLEDSMLVSDGVIDAYLDLIEKGIEYCTLNDVPHIVMSNQFGIPVIDEWYEKDLIAIASCPRLSSNHIERLHHILNSVVRNVPVGDSIGQVFMKAHVAFCSNHLVGLGTLSALLQSLAQRVIKEMLLSENGEGNGFLSGVLLDKIVDGIRKARHSESDVINLIESIGEGIGKTLKELRNPVGAAVALHSKLTSLSELIAHGAAQGNYRDRVVSNEEIAEAMKTVNYYEGNPVVDLIVKNSYSVDYLNSNPDLFVDAAVLITGVAKRFKKLEFDSASNAEQEIYIELMRRCTDLFFSLIDSDASNKVRVKAAARTIFTTIDNSFLMDHVCKDYSLSKTLDRIIKAGFVDVDFIKSSLDAKRITRLHARAFHDNPSISIDDMEGVIVDCYKKYMSATIGELAESGVKNNNLYEFLADSTPILLNKKYYPALLSNQNIDVPGLANAFEMGLFLSLLDEGDIRLIAKAGMSEVCRAANERHKITLASEPALNEVVTSLMLKERLEQVDASPSPSGKRRQTL